MLSEWKWFYDTAIDVVINHEGSGIPVELIKGEILTESGGYPKTLLGKSVRINLVRFWGYS